MTKQEAVEKLQALLTGETSGDTEAMHAEADHILCDLLTSLDCNEVIEAWLKIPKWYA